MSTRSVRVRVVSVLALFAAVAIPTFGCSSDDSSGSAEVQDFCEKLFASPTFACCTETDRKAPVFAARNRYQSKDDCSAKLFTALDSNGGKRSFDTSAASQCLAFLAGRACGVSGTKPETDAENNAGCGRVVRGTQEEKQSCTVSDDCKPGLVCPPGTLVCSTPAAISEQCVGTDTTSDHPACNVGTFCQFTGDNPAGCATPPCHEYHCVPYQEEGETCNARECAPGLDCRTGKCSKGGPSSVGSPCRLPEHCADGLYCDPGTGTCAPRLGFGTACHVSADENLAFQCKGYCNANSDGTGTCAYYCGSN